MKICKVCVLENYETVETIQKQAENLRNSKMGHSDDFVCQYIYIS